MKIIKVNLLFILALTVFTFSNSVFAQNEPQKLPEKIDLRFELIADAPLAEVGFDNPKSFWKVKYELYVTDFSEPEKLGLSRVNGGYKYLTPMIENEKFNKQFNKQIKKKATKIVKGSFTKKKLLSESNREVVVPFSLPQNIIEIYNQAVKSSEKNPTFVLFITQKVYVKNSAEFELKRSQFLIDFVPYRLIRDDRLTKYRDVSSMTLKTRINKAEDGKLEYKGGLFHGAGW